MQLDTEDVVEYKNDTSKQLVELGLERSICVKFIKELKRNNINVTSQLIRMIWEIEKVITYNESNF